MVYRKSRFILLFLATFTDCSLFAFSIEQVASTLDTTLYFNQNLNYIYSRRNTEGETFEEILAPNLSVLQENVGYGWGTEHNGKTLFRSRTNTEDFVVIGSDGKLITKIRPLSRESRTTNETWVSDVSFAMLSNQGNPFTYLYNYLDVYSEKSSRGVRYPLVHPVLTANNFAPVPFGGNRDRYFFVRKEYNYFLSILESFLDVYSTINGELISSTNLGPVYYDSVKKGPMEHYILFSNSSPIVILNANFEIVKKVDEIALHPHFSAQTTGEGLLFISLLDKKLTRLEMNGKVFKGVLPAHATPYIYPVNVDQLLIVTNSSPVNTPYAFGAILLDKNFNPILNALGNKTRFLPKVFKERFLIYEINETTLGVIDIKTGNEKNYLIPNNVYGSNKDFRRTFYLMKDFFTVDTQALVKKEDYLYHASFHQIFKLGF